MNLVLGTISMEFLILNQSVFTNLTSTKFASQVVFTNLTSTSSTIGSGLITNLSSGTCHTQVQQ
jgi:hypothetical protein